MRWSRWWTPGWILGAGLAALPLACRPSAPSHEHEGGAAALEEDVPTRSVTVWDQGFELFLEYPFPVAGEPLPVITHVTRLDTAEPRRTGSIALYAGPPGEAGSVFLDPMPRRDGVYVTEVVFGTPGACSFAVEIRDEEVRTRIELPSVEVFADAAARDQAPLPAEAGGVILLKEQAWRFGMRTEVVGPQAVHEELRAPAYVLLHPERHGEALALVAGRLEAPAGGNFPRLGQRVEQGAVLAEVVPLLSELELQLVEAASAVASSRLDLQQAEQEHERTAALHAKLARSDRELEESRFALEQARLRVASAQTVQESWQRVLGEVGTRGGDASPRFPVRAPVGGLVHRIHLAPGSLVEEGQALCEVLDTTSVIIEARVRDDVMARVLSAGSPLVRIPGAPGEPGRVLAEGGLALLLAEGRQDPTDLTVGLLYEMQNPDRVLREGQRVEVSWSVGTSREVLAIPPAAIIDVDGQSVAFVQTAGETFEERALTLGIQGRERVEVLSGLAAGERVVHEGAYAIRLATASGAVPEHSH